ncbi:MAG: amidohydrolase [Candidatus Micrarchaeaceae archaeon]
MSKIIDLSNNKKNEIIELRELLHSQPELAHREFSTNKILLEYLQKLDLDIKSPVAGTGIIATLRGKGKGKTVAIRADMDALPIQEENNLPFKSLHDGIMHACGHDAHMSMVYGAIKVLSDLKDQFDGNIRVIFQPAEEEGTLGGAKPMIEEGALKDVDYILGMHVWEDLPEGKIGYKAGPLLASADMFNAMIIGKGGHAASPHMAVDPIVISARIIETLQTIASREIDPLESVVITIGSINGGSAPNVIPERVELRGTIRTLNNEIRNTMEQRLKRIFDGITRSSNATFDLRYIYGYPATINDKKVTEIVKESLSNLFGADTIVEVKPTLAGEDFSYYLQRTPGTYLVLGLYNEKLGYIYPTHNPKFNLNENILPIGAAALVESALTLLKH